MKTLSWTTSEVTYINNGSASVKTGWFLCLFNEDMDPIATHCIFTYTTGHKPEYEIPSQFGMYEAVIRLAEEAGADLKDIDTSNTIGKLAEIRHDIAKHIKN